jgi:hypothetical protein
MITCFVDAYEFCSVIYEHAYVMILLPLISKHSLTATLLYAYITTLILNCYMLICEFELLCL